MYAIRSYYGVCQDPTKDLLVESANNFYEGVTQKEAESRITSYNVCYTKLLRLSF